MFNNYRQTASGIVNQPAATKIIIGLTVFYSMCFLTGLGKLLILLFPITSFIAGIYFYYYFPSIYISFSFWLLFLGPVVRRLIDYQSGYLTPGPWIFTPLLVSFITIITLIKELPKFYQNKSYQISYFPFILYFFSLVYGLIIGLVQNPLDAVIVDFLGQLSPFCFGFHLFVNWQNYPQYRHAIKQSFYGGVLLMGIYGVWQFMIAPGWDIFWMIEAETNSFGKPEPFGIRTMSTMSSPQAFAAAMLAGLLLLLNERKTFIYFPTTIFGYLTFMLSQARAGWLSFIVGIFVFTSSLKSSKQIQVIISILILSIIVFQLIYIEPFSSIILERFSSLSDAKFDGSLNYRTQVFQSLINYALTEIVGQGLGTDYDLFGGRDGSILQTLFVFGWIGSIFLLGGLLLLFLRLLFQFKVSRQDSFVNASLAITIGIISQIGFNLIFLTSIGMIFWSFMGITLASHKYYYNERLKLINQKLI